MLFKHFLYFLMMFIISFKNLEHHYKSVSLTVTPDPPILSEYSFFAYLVIFNWLLGIMGYFAEII